MPVEGKDPVRETAKASSIRSGCASRSGPGLLPGPGDVLVGEQAAWGLAADADVPVVDIPQVGDVLAQ